MFSIRLKCNRPVLPPASWCSLIEAGFRFESNGNSKTNLNLVHCPQLTFSWTHKFCGSPSWETWRAAPAGWCRRTRTASPNPRQETVAGTPLVRDSRRRRHNPGVPRSEAGMENWSDPLKRIRRQNLGQWLERRYRKREVQSLNSPDTRALIKSLRKMHLC